jgi:hypothetical protein
MTQKNIILKLLASQPDKKFFSYELMKASTPFGWLGSSGDRRARELAEEGLINKREGKVYAEYWHKPKPDVFQMMGLTKKPVMQDLFKSFGKIYGK